MHIAYGGNLTDPVFIARLANTVSLAMEGPRFQGLDKDLQHFIKQYTSNHKQLSELLYKETAGVKEVIQLEHERTRQEFRDQSKEDEKKAKHRKLVESLEYARMNQRRSDIAESHARTCDWIFQEPDGETSETSSESSNSFARWLKSDGSLYWISGKPGSGKSTLMKYLVHDGRTKEGLATWANVEPVVIHFFLWSVGETEQRTLHGLLCSLLHQLLLKVDDDTAVERLMNHFPDLQYKKRIHDWSTKELKDSILFWAGLITRHICIFLDGLDEIDKEDGTLQLIRIIRELRGKPRIKMCVSSRPDVELKDEFQDFPNLKMQDRTQKDIEVVVRDFLSEFPVRGAMDSRHKESAERIIKLILDRADGVFLWVILVLKRIRPGVSNYTDILNSIERLPKGLQNLYQEAWSRHGEDAAEYMQQGSRFFKLLLTFNNGPEHSEYDFYPWNTPTLFDFVICGNKKLETSIFVKRQFPSALELLHEIEECQRRIQVCCGGLLQIIPEAPYASDTPRPPLRHYHTTIRELWERFYAGNDLTINIFNRLLTPMSAFGLWGDTPSWEQLDAFWACCCKTRVEFIHRTVVEFLSNSGYGRKIMLSDDSTDDNILTDIVRSTLARNLLFAFPDWTRQLTLHLGRLPESSRDAVLPLVRTTVLMLLARAPVVETIVEGLNCELLDGNFDGKWSSVFVQYLIANPEAHPALYMPPSTFRDWRYWFHWNWHDISLCFQCLECTCIHEGLLINDIRSHASQLLDTVSEQVASQGEVTEWPVDIPRQFLQSSEVAGYESRPRIDLLSVYMQATTIIIYWRTEACFCIILGRTRKKRKK